MDTIFVNKKITQDRVKLIRAFTDKIPRTRVPKIVAKTKVNKKFILTVFNSVQKLIQQPDIIHENYI